jgi:hypothetical protein
MSAFEREILRAIAADLGKGAREGEGPLSASQSEEAERTVRLLGDLGRKLGKANKILEILRLSLDTAIQVTRMDWGLGYAIDAVSSELNLLVQAGAPDSVLNRLSHYSAESNLARRVKSGRPFYLVRIGHTDKGPSVMGAFPVLEHGVPVACLVVASKTRITIPHLARYALEAIAAQAGMAIVCVRSEEKLRVEGQRRIIPTIN